MGHTATSEQVEFWRLKRVMEVTGLSKSEIYRRIGAGRFPDGRTYPDSNMKFWISTDVLAWQRAVLGVDEFEDLLG